MWVVLIELLTILLWQNMMLHYKIPTQFLFGVFSFKNILNTAIYFLTQHLNGNINQLNASEWYLNSCIRVNIEQTTPIPQITYTMLRGSSNRYMRVASPARKSITAIISNSILTWNLRTVETQVILLLAEYVSSMPISGTDSPSPWKNRRP
jgi:hypothetical protein